MKDDEQAHPFAIVPVEVMMDNRLTLETMRVLVTLFSFRNKVTGLAFPKRERISERCGMHPSNISDATTKLVELGWLVKTGVGGYSKATRYDIQVPQTVAEQATVYKDKVEARKVAQQATVAQSATIAQPAIEEVAQQATRQVAQQATRNRTDQLTDQVTNIAQPDKSGSRNSDVPGWIASEAWEGFVAMRTRIRRPLTPYAMKLAVKSLEKLRDEGHDPNACLDQSTLNSWQSIHPVKSFDPPKKKEKFDPVAYVNRNRPNGGNGHEIVIEPEKRN